MRKYFENKLFFVRLIASVHKSRERLPHMLPFVDEIVGKKKTENMSFLSSGLAVCFGLTVIRSKHRVGQLWSLNTEKLNKVVFSWIKILISQFGKVFKRLLMISTVDNSLMVKLIAMSFEREKSKRFRVFCHFYLVFILVSLHWLTF